MSRIDRYLVAWRSFALPGREVIDGLVDPQHAVPSVELADELTAWPGPYYWSDEGGERHLVLIRPVASARPERWGLHAALLAATILTTLFSGAVFAGALPGGGAGGLGEDWWRALPAGWTYAIPLVVILFAHEMGHYVTARRYAIDVTPPYFLPWPFWPFIIGTLGAFIRLRSPVLDRRQLLDVGAGGPIAGFVVALPVLAIGLMLSQPLGVGEGPAELVMRIGPERWTLGHSLVSLALSEWLYPGAGSVVLHPAAFAGWIGILVTTLNLIPLSQLDGGHVLYATLGKAQGRLAIVFWIALLAMGYFWIGWVVWGFLVLFLSRGRLSHPAVVDEYRPLPAKRRVLAVLCLLLFIVSFTPVPFGAVMP